MSFATLVAASPPRRIRAWRRVLSFPAALSGLLAVLAVLTVRSRFDDPDMWWHLRMGEIVWTTHAIPATDLLSWTASHQASVPQEWLSQVLIYGAYKIGGYPGLMLWLSFFAAALLIAGYALCSLYSGNAKVGWLGAITIWFFATVGLAVRPQTIGYLLLVIELLLLELGRTRNARWFLWLPPLFALWVNCHGSFFLGSAVAVIFLFCSFFDFRIGLLASSRWDQPRRRMLALALILSAAALFLNPDGVKQVLYPVNIMFHLPISLGYIQEWLPLAMNNLRGLGLMGALACVFLLVILRRSELFWHELLLLALATWLAVSHRRMVFAFGIMVAPALSRLLSTCWENYHPEQDRPTPNAVLLAASLVAVVLGFPSRQSLQRQAEARSPVKAVEFMKSHHLAGRMLNEYGYGGYLIWAAPEYPVFIDGRADVFEWSGVLSKYTKWEALETDPKTLLDDYRIDFCLLSRNSPMAPVMSLLPGWRSVYSDNLSVIFVRTGMQTAPVGRASAGSS